MCFVCLEIEKELSIYIFKFFDWQRLFSQGKILFKSSKLFFNFLREYMFTAKIIEGSRSEMNH